MKKLSLISVAALMFASCSNEDVVPAGEGQEQQVTISLELPAEINSRAAGAATSAEGGLTNVNDKGLTFNVALYPKSGDVVAATPAFVGTTTVGAGQSVASFTPTVVLGKSYKVVAYASFNEGINWTENGIANVTASQVINEEAEDAYFANEEITASASMKATLTRPYGKLRIIANDYEEAMAAHYGNQDVSKVKVVYANGQSTEFNPQSGVFTTATEGALTIDADAITYAGEADNAAKTILADYIPAASSDEATIVTITSVEVTVSGETYTKVLNMDVPVKRNHLTTLSGDFFTSDAVLDLIVNDIFVTDSEINYELAAAIANGGVVVLTEDVIVKKPLEVTTDKPVVIDLNGHTITGQDLVNKGVIIVNNNKANVTIKGEGTITTSSAYPVYVNGTEAEVTIEGGNYTATNSTQAAYVQTGTLYIKGGYFNVDSKYNGTSYVDDNGNGMYVLNCSDIPYKNGTAKIIVTGGSFYKFDPSANVAEGTGTNFVADGYNVAEVGDVYMVVEGEVTVADTQEALTEALADGGTVVVAVGTYSVAGKSFTDGSVIKGVSAEETILDFGDKANGANGADVTFENVTVKRANVNYTGMHHSASENYVDCIIEGQPFLYGVEATFTRCTFEQTSADAYNVWTYGAKSVTFDNCVFNSSGKAVLIYSEDANLVQNVTFNNCKLNATSPVEGKAAIEIDSSLAKNGKYTININNTTAEGFALGSISGNSLWNEKKEAKNAEVYVDGEKVY